MNRWSHWLSAFSALMYVAIGLSALLQIGPRFRPPSWIVIYSISPALEWLWPGLFVLTGVIGAIGVARTDALALSLRLSSAIFLAWGVAGFYNIFFETGGNFQGPGANLYIAAWLLDLAHRVSRSEKTRQTVHQSRQIVEQGKEIDATVAALEKKVQANGGQ